MPSRSLRFARLRVAITTDFLTNLQLHANAETAALDDITLMSAYTLLYYPGFHPNAIWLRRILLLADDVVRIVPADANADDPDDLLELQNSVPGCLRAISPEE